MSKLDMSRATTGLAEDGVWIDHPEAPFRIKASIEIADDLPWLTSITFHVKPGHRHIAYRSWFATIPLHDIVKLAAAAIMGDDELNESLYRRIAAEPPTSSRVKAVAEWANQVAWPGGGAMAVSQMWGVSRSTAHRWLRQAQP